MFYSDSQCILHHKVYKTVNQTGMLEGSSSEWERKRLVCVWGYRFCVLSNIYTGFPPVNIDKVTCLALLSSGVISLEKVTRKGFLFSSDIFWPSCLVCLMSYVISTYSTYVTTCLSEIASTAVDLGLKH